MADEDVSIAVEAKGAEQAAAALKGVSQSIDGTGKAGRKAAPPVKKFEKGVGGAAREAKDLAVSAKAAEAAIKRMGRAATYANVRLKALERTQKRLARAQAKSGALGKVTGGGMGVPNVPGLPGGGGGGGGGGGRRKGKGVQKIGSGGVAGGAIIAMASKIGAIVYLVSALIPALVTAIASLGAGILGLGGALAPLGGLLVAYPGYLAAVGQAFLAVKLSMAGFTDGLKSMTDASMSWQEANTGLARFTGGGVNKSVAAPLLRDVAGLGTAFKYVGYQVQRTLIPGMRQALAVGRSMIPMLSGALTSTGTALGAVMSNIAGYLGSGQAQSLIQSILGTNTGIITAFGGAIKSVLNMVLELVNAAGPMLSRMARDIGAFMGRMSGQVGAGAQNGGLAKFFDSAYQAAKKVLAIIGPLVKGLWNIMKIGKPLGDALLASWGRMAQNFLMFTQSAGGVKKIADWFAYMKPILWEMGYLIRDIAKVLMSWSMAPGFIEMSQMLRRDLLPVIQQFVSTTASLMLPLMLDVAKAVMQIITAWQTASVTFIFFKMLTGYLSALGKLLSDTNGWISKTLTLFLAFFLALKVGAVVMAVYTKAAGRIAPVLALIRPAALFAAGGIKALALAIKGALLSTVIGAVVVAVGLLLEALMMAGSAKDDEIAKNKEWAASLYEVNGQLSTMAVQTTATNLKEAGAFGLAKQLNIEGSTIIKAAMNNKAALEQVKAATFETLDYWNKRIATGDSANDRIKIRNKAEADPEYVAAKKLMDILEPMAGAFYDEGVAAMDAAKALGIWGMSTEEADKKLAGIPSATATAIRGIDALTQATMRTVEAFQMLKGLLENIDYNVGLRDAGRSLAKTLKENGKNLGIGAKGDANRSAVVGIIKTYSERATAFDQAGNTPAALKAMTKGQALLIKTIADSLFSGKRAQAREWAKNLLGPKVWEKQRRATANMQAKVRLEGTSVQGATGGHYEGHTWVPNTSVNGVTRGQSAAGARYAGQAGPKDITPPLVANTSSTDLNTTALNNLKVAMGMLPGALAGIVGTSIPAGTPMPQGSPAATGGGGRNYDYSWRYAGGPVSAGRNYMVGEIGPEGFLDKMGNMSVIGAKGPEIKKFSSSGTVIPNNELAGVLAAHTKSSGGASGVGVPIGGDGIHVHIGSINPQTDFDVVQAVKRGIREAERDRRERS